jgi:hypothetical protein
MADANARLERLCRRNAVRGHTEPIFRRQHVSAEEEEEEDLESSYLPSGRTEPSLSFTATATSRARSGSQLAPTQALAMAQELLRYQPTTDGHEGWRARIAELVAIANADPALGGAQDAGEPDPAVGHRAPGARDGKAAQAKKMVSRAASSPRGEPSCQIVQCASEDAHVSLERRCRNHDCAINDIGEAGKNVKVTGDPVYNPGCLALTRQQCYVVWPDKFRPDISARYDGTSNPVEFLQLYVIAVQAARGDQHVMANWFPMALKDAPQTWLMNLPHESVISWKDLCRQFIANFMPTYECPATKNDLKAVHQYKGETLRQYIQRFNQMRNKIPRISNEEVISMFSMGVANIKMKKKLSVNDELTSIVRLFEIADRCAKAEEGRLFVHNLLEALPPKPKSKDPKSMSRRPLKMLVPRIISAG